MERICEATPPQPMTSRTMDDSSPPWPSRESSNRKIRIRHPKYHRHSHAVGVLAGVVYCWLLLISATSFSYTTAATADRGRIRKTTGSRRTPADHDFLTIGEEDLLEPILRVPSSPPPRKGDGQRHHDRPQRILGHHHKNGIYKFLDKNETLPYSTIGDVWLCLAFALGWTVWLLSLLTQQHHGQSGIDTNSSMTIHYSEFDTNESRKVMGNVLQVSLGEDNLGTGIPVYHAVVDYVLVGDDADAEPIQVRKVFCTNHLLEEGFANVEVLVLYDDPTTAILMDDYVRQKKEVEQQQETRKKNEEFGIDEDDEDDGVVPTLVITVMTYTIAAILISVSLIGAVLIILRLPSNRRVFGWVSLGVAILMLYPTAKGVYSFICYIYRLIGPLSDRPGVIINGSRFATCTNQCHANLDPREVFEMSTFNVCGGGNSNDKNDKNRLDLSGLQLPSVDEDSSHNGGGIQQSDTDKKVVASTPKNLMYPNAGCGLGEYRVHMPRMRSNCSGRTDSSLSSLSASGHSKRNRSLLNLPILVKWEAKTDVDTT